MTAALSLRGVRVRLGSTTALDGVDLQVQSGSVTALLGPSGCGKTTLLRVAAGFLRADAGRVELAGRVVQDERRFLSAAARRVGYVAQEGALFPHLSVADNIAFGLPRVRGRRRRTAHARRVEELLDMVGLDGVLVGRLPHELSGGQQQRVALARALAPAPALVLLDEPFSGLDTDRRLETGRATVQAVRRSGASALLVTHDQAEALSLCDEVGLLRRGSVVQVGTPAQVYAVPADVDAAHQVGAANVLHARAHGHAATCALGDVAIAGGPLHGDVDIVLRPEQLVVHEHGTDAVVVSTRFFGHDCIVDLRVADGHVVSARTDTRSRLIAGTRLGVTVNGTATAFRPENAPG